MMERESVEHNNRIAIDNRERPPFIPTGVAIDQPLDMEAVVRDRKTAHEVRVKLETGEVTEAMREKMAEIALESFEMMHRIKYMRRDIESGHYLSAWDMVEAFEIPELWSPREGLEPSGEKGKLARRNFYAWIDRVHEAQARGGKEEVMREVAKKFFIETEYELSQNSLIEGFTDENAAMNCDAKFKGVAVSLEIAGFDPSSEIFVHEYLDHVRVLIKTSDGYVVIDGDDPLPYEPEPGTAFMPLNDYKRMLVGLDPEHRVTVAGGNVEAHAHQTKISWRERLFGSLFTKEMRVSQPFTDEGVWRSSMDELTTPQWLSVMLDNQLIADVNERLEGLYGNAKARAKAIASWRSTKLAMAGTVAMAMYSACGPTVERAVAAKSPDEAADVIKDDVLDLKKIIEEKIDQVADVVEKVFERHEEQEPSAKKKDEKVMSGNIKQEKTPFTPMYTEQVPYSSIELTKEQVYYLIAQQELTYDVADFIIGQKLNKELEVEIGDVLRIEMGSALVVTPDCWRTILKAAGKQGSEGAPKLMQVDLIGERAMVDATGDALHEAWDDLIEEEDGERGTRGSWRNVRLSITRNGQSYPNAAAVTENGVEFGNRVVRWEEVVSSRASEPYVMAVAQGVADAMGDSGLNFVREDDIIGKERAEEFVYDASSADGRKVVALAQSSNGKRVAIFEGEQGQIDSGLWERRGYDVRLLTPEEKREAEQGVWQYKIESGRMDSDPGSFAKEFEKKIGNVSAARNVPDANAPNLPGGMK